MNLRQRITSWTQTLKNWVENALFLQAVCTLVSVPILCGWQMPYSKLSTVGNLLFAPCMATFIFLSAMIFLCSLINFFPTILLQSFAKFIQIWTFMLKQGSSSWLSIPGKIVLMVWLVGAVGCAYFTSKQACTKTIRHFLIGWLIIFTLTLFAQNNFCWKKDKTVTFYKGRAKIEVSETPQGLFIKDLGVFGRSQSVEKFIIYNFRRFLLKHFGHTNIATLKLTRLSNRSLNAAEFCCHFFKVKILELPKNWQTSLFFTANQDFMLKKLNSIQAKNVKITPLSSSPGLSQLS